MSYDGLLGLTYLVPSLFLITNGLCLFLSFIIIILAKSFSFISFISLIE